MEEYATIDRIKAESFQTVKTSATKDKLMSYLKRQLEHAVVANIDFAVDYFLEVRFKLHY